MNIIAKITSDVGKLAQGAVQKEIHSRYEALPTIPIADLRSLAVTFKRLSAQEAETKPIKLSLIRTYTINGRSAMGHEFLYGYDMKAQISAAVKALQETLDGDKDLIKQLREVMDNNGQAQSGDTSHDITKLSLDDPKQWAMSWSPMRDIYDTGKAHLDRWASSLVDHEAATEQFWPTIATYGHAFNLLVLQKATSADISMLKSKFQTAWTSEMDDLAENGLLYFIDFSIFTTVKPQKVDGSTRFTPATITLLQQHLTTKALTPIAVRVSGYEDKNHQIYTDPSKGSTTPSAWLYALQAAKVSITVYGIWLGHVYHYHIVSAAMLMTLAENVPDGHPLRKLIDPQSKHVIEFNTLLLLIWKAIAPPASIASASQFLELSNTFATGREFGDDDPIATLERHNIREADFTEKEPWDKYPIVKDYLEVWQATAKYISAFVEETYSDDAAIVADQALQDWITASGNPGGGNLRGLPEMTNKQALKQVLTSLIYRLTIHGVGRLNKTSQPALSFVANFPPCLQQDVIPSPSSNFDTKALLQYLPKTGTIGRMLEFLFLFSFSTPVEPLISAEGVDSNLFFDEGSPCNDALVAFRQDIISFMMRHEDDSHYKEGDAVIQRWPMSIEI